MKNRQLYLVVIGVLLLGGAVWADDNDEEGRGRGLGTSQADSRTLEFRLVQVAAFNPVIVPGTSATDQLTAGANNRLTVQRDRTVQVEFRPAAPTAATTPTTIPTYRVWFCRYGGLFSPSAVNGCVALVEPPASPTSTPVIAGFKPDGDGFVRGTAVFPKPQVTDVWVGAFAITRDTVDAAQFVSAIEFDTAANGAPIGDVTGPEVELHGEILEVGTQSFTLTGMDLTIKVDASTRFDGRPNSIADLKAGMTVVVSGVMQADTAGKPNFLLAQRVRAEHEK